MSKTIIVIAVLLACALVFALAGCVTLKNPAEPESTVTPTVSPSPSPTPAPTEKPLSQSEELQKAAHKYLDALACPLATGSDNGLGLSVTRVEKAGEEYKVSWECGNPDAAGNEAIIFASMRFFDPEDFSNSYQAFTVTPDGQIQYTFGAGDLLSYNTFRIRFVPDCKIVYLYFEGVLPSSGAPEEFYTEPMFFTLILGDEPMVLETTPRLANGIFDSYIAGAATTGSNNQNLPLTLTAYDNTYIIDKVEAGFDEDGNTTVTITGTGLGTIPMRDGEFVLPIGCSFTSGGENYDYTGANISSTQMIFSFDTSAVPESITLYPADNPDNATEVGSGI